MNRFLMLGCVSLSLVLVGCGSNLPDTVPVTGTVTVDGEPVEGATVNFLNQESGLTAMGKTDADGKFTLKTVVGSQMVEGAIVGKHVIAVVKTESDGPEMKDPKEIMAQMTTNPAITSEYTVKHLIPKKYSNPLQSQLEAEVTQAGPNEVELQLKS